MLGNLFGQFRLETLAEDRDLGDGDLVEPGLDERPDGGKEVGRVDDVKLAHHLGV